MATTTTPIDYAGHHEAADAAPKSGFFARFVQRMTETRMKRARAYVLGYLTQLTDARLADLGFTTDEAKALREKGRIPANYWG